jgi:hypothetical protein
MRPPSYIVRHPLRWIKRKLGIRNNYPRVFGIGMQKTATSSLAAALNALGYATAHWESPESAGTIWREVQSSGRSRTLENYDAACDTPIPILYQKLDVAYPGSKFILTIRNEDAWVKSAQKHWKRYRNVWDQEPFTHAMHKELYGQIEFSEDVFRKRFTRHTEEVMAYFAERRDDLLIMNMDLGAGWSELCRFLEKPIPKIPYPREAVTP